MSAQNRRVAMAVIAACAACATPRAFAVFAEKTTGPNPAPGDVLYVDAGASLLFHDRNGKDANLADAYPDYTKKIFLSPDKKTLAVTLQPLHSEIGTVTYLSDVDGSRATKPRDGSFMAWSPDGSQAYLFASGSFERERGIFRLDTDGDYADAGFPKGTIDVDVNPVRGESAYSLASDGGDETDIWLRGPDGKDRILVEGSGRTLTWMRWSPDGSRLAFLAYGLEGEGAGRQSVWVVGVDGSEAVQLDDVLWDYPPVWSPDGTYLAYAKPDGDGSEVWTYAVQDGLKEEASKGSGAMAFQPAFDSAGALFFVAGDKGGSSELWKNSGGTVSKVTSTGTMKGYPLPL